MAGVKERAVLVLEDGTVYHGYAFGARGKTVGEVVFNTAQTGYQEIMTDPSYHGQIVVMTYPHQGNYGVNVYDMQSNRPWVRGFVAKEFSRVASNPRAQQTIGEFMEFYGVVGIEGIDTRALVRKIREGGVLKGTIAHASLFGAPDHAFTQEELEALRREAQAWTDIDGRDMTPEVSTPLPYAWPTLKSGRRIVVMDFGIKHAIVENLAALGFEVIVVPGKTPAHQIMALEPHGLLISNGPGDPTMPRYAHETIWKLMGLLPTFGICLGHQLLALAVPYAGLSLPLAVLLLQAAFADLPPELEDAARLGAVRAAVGDGYEILTDGNQGFSLSEAIRRARMRSPNTSTAPSVPNSGAV